MSRSPTCVISDENEPHLNRPILRARVQARDTCEAESLPRVRETELPHTQQLLSQAWAQEKRRRFREGETRALTRRAALLVGARSRGDPRVRRPLRSCFRCGLPARRGVTGRRGGGGTPSHAASPTIWKTCRLQDAGRTRPRVVGLCPYEASGTGSRGSRLAAGGGARGGLGERAVTAKGTGFLSGVTKGSRIDGGSGRTSVKMLKPLNCTLRRSGLHGVRITSQESG